MIEAVDQTVHPFMVKTEDGTVLGGSYDNISAVTIMCCSAQLYAIQTGSGAPLPVITVEDSTGAVIAQLGSG